MPAEPKEREGERGRGLSFCHFSSNGKQKFGGAIKAKWFLGLWKFMTGANYWRNCMSHRYSRCGVFIARDGTCNGPKKGRK